MSNNIIKHFKDVKQAIRKKNPVDTYFVSRYSFSPYMACQHACKYCDGRAEKYYVEGDYERDIVIRKNLPLLLKKELPNLREQGIISIGSGISDPYQQVEASAEILKRSLDILADHKFPVTILTKSSLILRDLEILKQINAENGVLLMMSITTLDDEIRQIFEPGASSVEERLRTLKQFHQAGLPIGVLAMPFLPFITDTKESMKSLFTELKQLGVDFILPGFLTLRPGIQKQTFLAVIESFYPQLKKAYQQLYSNELRSGNPQIGYRKIIGKLTAELIDELKIPRQIPHYVYHDRLSLPDEIYVLLQHLGFLYKEKNVDISRLKSGFDNYRKWLLEQRKYFLRRRNLPDNYLTTELLETFETKEMYRTVGNEKLYDFLQKAVIQRKIFDYINLKFD